MCLGQPALTVPLASGGLHAQDWADGVWRSGPKQMGRQREKQEPARSVPEGKGPAPGHGVYYRQRGPPQGTHTTGGPIPAPGHPSVHLPTLSALLPGYQSNHTLTHLSSRHGANSQKFKPRVPRSPVLGPPVISRINGDFPYLMSPNPGAMAQVSGTSTTHMVSFLQLPNPQAVLLKLQEVPVRNELRAPSHVAT